MQRKGVRREMTLRKITRHRLVRVLGGTTLIAFLGINGIAFFANLSGPKQFELFRSVEHGSLADEDPVRWRSLVQQICQRANLP
jgi:hypothetical protein